MEQIKLYDQQRQIADNNLHYDDSYSSDESSESATILENNMTSFLCKNLISIIIYFAMLSLFIGYQTTQTTSVVCNDTKIPETVEVIERINWWEKYITYCCLLQTRYLDCSADDLCAFYLGEWLVNNNLTMDTLKRCCYHYTSFGSNISTGHCYLHCLNSEKR